MFKDGNPYKNLSLKHIFDMHENCPVCEQKYDLEPGFWIGTGYVSYALTVAYFVSTFVAWKVLIGMTFDLDDNRIFYWMSTAIITLLFIQPILMRLSRSIWLGWFVSYNKHWKNEPLEYNERMDEHMKEI